MAKVSFDGVNKLIIVDNAITALDVGIDLYSEWKKWVLIGDNSKYPQALTAIGGEPLAAGQNLGTTYFLENGWRIRPFEGDHSLTITGNIYTRESGQSPVVHTIGSFNVLISLTRSNLVDTISTSGSPATDPVAVASAVWNYNSNQTFPANTFGEYVITKLLTVAQYLGMK